MSARIVGFRLPDPPRVPHPSGDVPPVAILAIEVGPLIICGVRLHLDPDGTLRLRTPRMRASRDRVVLRRGAEQEEILRQAAAMLAEIIPAFPAASPLATASDTTEHCQ
jgi:hypothetical protein